MAITPLMPVYPRCAVRPVRGEGVYLYGEQGEKYLDFAAGIAVNLLGHGHPHLTKAIQEQAATLIHVSNLYGSPQGEAFAQRLVDLTFADTVFFTNSGAEAVECAIKTARRYHHAKGNPHKHDLITFSNAFHGRTMATISATDQAKMHRRLRAAAAGLQGRRVRQSRRGAGRDRREYRRLPARADPGRGRHPPGQPGIHRRACAQACDEHDLMLVFDEVQCGVARTGTLYAYEQYGIDARHHGLGQGHRRRLPAGRLPRDREGGARAWSSAPTARPMAATRWRWPRARRCSTSSPTTSSSPTSGQMGERLRSALEQMIPNHDHLFESVRGMGLMLGIKMKTDSRAFVNYLRDAGPADGRRRRQCRCACCRR